MILACDRERVVRATLDPPAPASEDWCLLAFLLAVERSAMCFLIPRTSGRSVARDVDIIRKDPSAACVMDRYT